MSFSATFSDVLASTTGVTGILTDASSPPYAVSTDFLPSS